MIFVNKDQLELSGQTLVNWIKVDIIVTLHTNGLCAGDVKANQLSLRCIMQAVVKTPHIKINVQGDIIPTKLLFFLKEEYGNKVKFVEEESDKLVNALNTQWYRDIKTATTPGDYLRIYRERNGLTQTKLGEMVGCVPRQHISNMEKGGRPISLKTARKFAAIFDVPFEIFLGRK
jgi:DNA-binding XRE family transcriptional regulator